MTRLFSSPNPDADLAPEAYQTSDTSRIWVSDQQWMAMLASSRRDTDAFLDAPARPNRPTHPHDGNHPIEDAFDEDRREGQRLTTTFRCVLRLDGHRAAGTFAVRTQNVSAGGLGFIHSSPIPRDTRCTVALQPEHTPGIIAAARIAWCKPLHLDDQDDPLHTDAPAPPTAYELGIQFDTPIDLDPFNRVA
ncbi:MAG: PilZ domain-containing protein [Planctomycetota bacterium]